MHPLRVTVWCGLWNRGIIGPYSFENEGGASITDNKDTYRTMIINDFVRALHCIDLNDDCLFGFNRKSQLIYYFKRLMAVQISEMAAKKLRFYIVLLYSKSLH